MTAPTLEGSYYRAEPGDTLWRIAHAFGVDVSELASVNRLRSVKQLEIGQQLFIPLPPESASFLWPAWGRRRVSTAPPGVTIKAPKGTLVRASRSGRVAVATRKLAGWGPTVVLDHGDGYLTIYAGLEQLLSVPGTFVRQGMPIGRLGDGELHFEIRQGASAREVLTLLP